MPKNRRSERPALGAIDGAAPARSAAAQGSGLESPWQVVVARVAGNRLALRFFATFGLLALVYFTATLDLKLQEPDSPRAHPVAAALAGANQWVRHTVLEPYQRGIAAVSAALLGAIGHEAEAQGREIRSTTFAVAITSGCDALEPSLLLLAAMASFPARWREKFAGFLAGAAAIAALNVVRVVTLWLVGLHWRGAFDVMHFTIWPFLIILCALFIFIHWLRYVAGARGRRAAAVF